MFGDVQYTNRPGGPGGGTHPTGPAGPGPGQPAPAPTGPNR